MQKDENSLCQNKLQLSIRQYLMVYKLLKLLKNNYLDLLFLLLLYSFAGSCSDPEQLKIPANKSFVISTDISNQQINSFAEDAFGHIWIATPRGVNKHNVSEYHQYFSSNDSLSISGNRVQHIFRDSQNRLWFSTGNGVSLYTDKDCFKRIKIETFSQNAMQILENKKGKIFLNMVEFLCEYDEKNEVFRVVIPDFDSDSRWQNRCFIDSKGDLWSISGSFIRCFDTDTKKLKSRFDFGNNINYAFLHENGELWIASGITISIFDTVTEKFMDLPAVIKDHPVLGRTVTTLIYPYSDSELLINAHNGLFLYNTELQTVIHQSEDGFPFVAPKFKITTMFTDSHNNLWLGSYDQGFEVKYSYPERFNNNSYLVSYFKNKSVTSITADQNENIWITTSLDGIFFYDIDHKIIHPIEVSEFFPENKYFTNNVKSIFIDKENFLWLITETDRVVKCRYDGRRLHLVNDYSLKTSITAVTEDNFGTIYAIGFNSNIYILRKGDSEFQHKQLYDPDFYVFTSAMIRLSDGSLCISSFSKKMIIINPENWDIFEVDIQKFINSYTLIPTVLFEDSHDDIWIGTRVNGLYRYMRKTNQLAEVEGIASSDITAIQEDTQSNIWVSTFYGLSKFDRETGKLTNYYKSDGIGGNQFNERSICQLSDGTLFFGGTHGLTFFNPSQFTVKQNIPLLFENLKIHQQIVFPYRNHIIDRHLSYRPTIKLKYYQNSFSISFTALDYSEFERMNYEYMLEGYDKMWIDAGNNNHEAYYSNLPAGKYLFRVKITDKNNQETTTENSIEVRISSAPAASWQAITIYLITFVLFAFFVIRFWRKVKKDRENALQIRHEKEQEEMVNKMNMDFFANVSHEFRTPLTMITGPIKTLCDDERITDDNKQLLYIVQRSVRRLLKLISQLLDFNKMEYDVLQLEVCRADIVFELNNIIDIYRLNINNRKINLITVALEDSFQMWLDMDKLDKIMGNLMTNALKFTPSGGKIVVSFDVINDNAIISVQNSGKGIPEDQLEKIFERYYQIDQGKGRYNWGTGIGLYYARRLAEIHHGTVKATNVPEGGAIFTLLLPTNDVAYLKDKKIIDVEEQKNIYPLPTEEQYKGKQTKQTIVTKTKILVVDDDSEIVHYLKTMLSPHYMVISSFNATDALKMIEEEMPELILSDVKMPDMSGFEFCQTIKSDIYYCHIPVVLVTAKTTVENQVEGLDAGADAYVTKPFDPVYLLALIKSQLKNRENVRRLLSKETKTDNIVEQNMLSPHDNAFMTELYQLMETELSNSELNITRVTEVLRISRTKLYYKIKSLTGNNPHNFFKTYKLNRAAEFLREGKLNISEISDITGFSTLPHFSASFKKHFGVPPSEYV